MRSSACGTLSFPGVARSRPQPDIGLAVWAAGSHPAMIATLDTRAGVRPQGMFTLINAGVQILAYANRCIGCARIDPVKDSVYRRIADALGDRHHAGGDEMIDLRALVSRGFSTAAWPAHGRLYLGFHPPPQPPPGPGGL